MLAVLRVSLAAAGCTLLLSLAAGHGTWLAWAGAVGVGATATSAVVAIVDLDDLRRLAPHTTGISIVDLTSRTRLGQQAWQMTH